MIERLNYRRVAPKLLGAMLELEKQVRVSGLECSLLELIRLRASQINGCAYCVDMHTKDARAAGETEQRLYAVAVWREAPFFSDRERMALEWTEALTLVSHDQMPDELYDRARGCFSEQELVALSWAVIAINGWNRIAITFRPEVGAYQSATRR